MTPQTTDDRTGSQLPPPAWDPPAAASQPTQQVSSTAGTPTPRTPAPRTPAPRTPWRERLPELVGAIGMLLVVAAVAGFLSAQWEELDRVGRAIVLGAAAGGLTAAATWLERRTDNRLSQLTSMLWVTGSATLGASVILGASVGLDGMARITALLAGLAVAGHALLAVSRDPSSPLRQLGVVGGLLVAAGPFGTDLADRATWDTVGEFFVPFAGLVDLTLTDEAFLYTGIAHLVIGGLWLAWAVRTDGRAAQVAWVGSTLLLAYAALELHVLPYGIGAFAALLLVLAYLVHGMVTERTGAVVTGTIGAMVAGGRVLWSLFSGEVATTIAAFGVGLALLTWAVRARTNASDDADRRSDEDARRPVPEPPAAAH